jgi:IS5 family transposase
VVNALLARKGLLLKRGSIVDATIIAAPSSTKTPRAREIPRCTRRRKATNGSSG